MAIPWIAALAVAAGIAATPAAPPDRRPKDAATVQMDQRITYPTDQPRQEWSADEAAAQGEDRARDPCPGRGPRDASLQGSRDAPCARARARVR